MVKKGDTLIEVCIAIGIFSLIAIGVAAVMSSGTAGSQTALETTLAREEIDAQADALRFVHESYMNAKNSSSDPANDPYYKIWKAITTGDGNGDANALAPDDSITQYNPNSCKALYDSDSSDSIFKQNAFVLNTKELDNPSNALVSSKNSGGKFNEATTYPRLIFDDNSNNLSSAEGLYVIAVKDSGTDMVVKGDRPTSTTAFYDFYIRSCWYGTDADRPTSISTVIRLYDPPASEASPPADDSYIIINYRNTDNPPAPDFNYSEISVEKGNPKVLEDPRTLTKTAKYRFRGWNVNHENTTCDFSELKNTYGAGELFKVPDTFVGKCSILLDADWNTAPFNVTFNSNGGDFDDFTSGTKSESCAAFQPCEENYTIPDKYFDMAKSGFMFQGWSEDPNTDAQYTAGNKQIGQLKGDVNLYAVWGEQNEKITIKADWTSNTDYDSNMELSEPGSDRYIYAYYGTDNINVTYNGQTYSLVTGHGDGHGNGWSGSNNIKYEQFTINTLGGKNYYYSIRRYSTRLSNNTIEYGGNVGNDITIKLTGNYLGTRTFYSKDKPNSSNCNYWNVFAYKNGRIIYRNTCSSSMEYGY